ncbi:hypothetical protein BCV70DRAFT_7645 [Testicularia cyperi]|uniref:TM7S3/TM198-like domain-containing protein n=1 Tax=Testicularia cyperi TaxID=1882483 RepID=A0A317XX67_9BASI|nr:hypothetical protein BCV70DRAFT_7645 [Testicularia cyperi]
MVRPSLLHSALTLAALLSLPVIAQQPSSTASSPGASITTAPSSANSTTQSSSTFISTITTTLSSGTSLPTSLTSSASRNGSVWYIPVITAVPITTTQSANATSTSVSAPSTATNAASTTTPKATTLPLKTVIDPAFGVLGAILILTGLPMAFYGHRNRWSSYFLAGFFSLALICISIILKVGVVPAINPPSRGIRGLFLVASVIAGVIGGALSILFWRGAGLMASGLGGFFFGLFLQAVRSGGLIHPVGLRYILYIGLYAVFFAVSCIERTHSLVLALSTAITGATALTLGIDCYSTQGLKEFYVRNLGFDMLFSAKYPPTFQNGGFPLVQGMQIELGVLGALILMGFAFQIRLWSDLRQQLAVLKRSDERRNMRSKAERAARAIAKSAKHDLAAWEARHGYSKTASGTTASNNDVERTATAANGGDATGRYTQSRTSSFMSLLRPTTHSAQLGTPTSMTEKAAYSPGVSSTLGGTAFPFPPQSHSRNNSNFLDYLKHGPPASEQAQPEPLLKLDLPSASLPITPLEDGVGSSARPAVARSEPNLSFTGSQRTPVHSVGNGNRADVSIANTSQSLDLTRATVVVTPQGQESFRRRSASTAALMNNATSFLELPPSESSPSKSGSASNASSMAPSRSRHASNGATTEPNPLLLSQSVHERTLSTPDAHVPVLAAVPMAPRLSHQGELSHRPHLVGQYDHAYQPPETPSASVRRSSSPMHGGVVITNDGPSAAAVAARRSLAHKRDERPLVPWSNPGASAGTVTHKRGSSSDAPRVRAMSIEELEARHRAKLAAMQKPATETVNEADALRRAKDEWERKQKAERRRMLEREAQRMAAAAGNGHSTGGSMPQSTAESVQRAGSRDERRRSRALSATMLEAVGEESRDISGFDKTAEWSKRVSGIQQLDPRDNKASMPASAANTRPSSPGPMDAATGRPDPAFPNPFPSQPVAHAKRLSDTDRRRMSQGAGQSGARRSKQVLLDFKLPGSP